MLKYFVIAVAVSAYYAYHLFLIHPPCYFDENLKLNEDVIYK